MHAFVTIILALTGLVVHTQSAGIPGSKRTLSGWSSQIQVPRTLRDPSVWKRDVESSEDGNVLFGRQSCPSYAPVRCSTGGCCEVKCCGDGCCWEGYKCYRVGLVFGCCPPGENCEDSGDSNPIPTPGSGGSDDSTATATATSGNDHFDLGGLFSSVTAQVGGSGNSETTTANGANSTRSSAALQSTSRSTHLGMLMIFAGSAAILSV